MTILVDTSVWVDYFRSGKNSDFLDLMIDENLIFTNDLILAELIPFLKNRRKRKVVELLTAIEKLSLSIDWPQIIDYQTRCVKAGLNGVGIPDLIIAQNAKQNRCRIYSLDRHFVPLQDILAVHVLQ